MTTTANTSEDTSREIHRQVCAYLKGYIVGYAKRRGMKWDGDETRTEEFKQGFEDSSNCDDAMVTVAHIVYNRIRHNKPHRKTKELDDDFIYDNRWRCSKCLKKIIQYGYNLTEVI